MTDTFIALATALVLLATAIVGLLMKIHGDVQEVHVMVNSRMNEALARITQLHAALVDAGVAVPDNGREP